MNLRDSGFSMPEFEAFESDGSSTTPQVRGADFHTHSKASDGGYTVDELCRGKGRFRGFLREPEEAPFLWALSDHNTFKGSKRHIANIQAFNEEHGLQDDDAVKTCAGSEITLVLDGVAVHFGVYLFPHDGIDEMWKRVDLLEGELLSTINDLYIRKYDLVAAKADQWFQGQLIQRLQGHADLEGILQNFGITRKELMQRRGEHYVEGLPSTENNEYYDGAWQQNNLRCGFYYTDVMALLVRKAEALKSLGVIGSRDDLGCGRTLKNKFRQGNEFYIATTDANKVIDARTWLPILNELADFVVFNHPLKYEKEFEGGVLKKIGELAREGYIQGLGVFNPGTRNREDELLRWAQELHLLPVPESDYHGPPRNKSIAQYCNGDALPFPIELQRFTYIT